MVTKEQRDALHDTMVALYALAETLDTEKGCALAGLAEGISDVVECKVNLDKKAPKLCQRADYFEAAYKATVFVMMGANPVDRCTKFTAAIQDLADQVYRNPNGATDRGLFASLYRAFGLLT